jgi:hypothetical protein
VAPHPHTRTGTREGTHARADVNQRLVMRAQRNSSPRSYVFDFCALAISAPDCNPVSRKAVLMGRQQGQRPVVGAVRRGWAVVRGRSGRWSGRGQGGRKSDTFDCLADGGSNCVLTFIERLCIDIEKQMRKCLS